MALHLLKTYIGAEEEKVQNGMKLKDDLFHARHELRRYTTVNSHHRIQLPSYPTLLFSQDNFA
jgi:hypothetical protein